jgi:hypothetical protein
MSSGLVLFNTALPVTQYASPYPGATLDLFADIGIDNPSTISKWKSYTTNVATTQPTSGNRPVRQTVLNKFVVSFDRNNQQHLMGNSVSATWQALYIIFKLNTATFHDYDGIFLYRTDGYTGNFSDEQYCINGIPGTRNITDGLTANPDMVASEAWLNGVAVNINNLHDDGVGVPISAGWNILTIHKPGNLNIKVPYIGVDPIFPSIRAASISIGRILGYEQFSISQRTAVETWAKNYYSTSITLYSDAVLADTPKFYYKLNTTTGTEYSLGSNSSPALTYNSAITRNRASLVKNEDGAASFSGAVGTNATFSDSSLSGKIDVTIECVIKLNTTNNVGCFVKLGNDTNGLGVGVGSTAFDFSGSNLIVLAETIAWVPTGYNLGNTIHHIAVTANATTNVITCYIDGSQVFQQTVNWRGFVNSTIAIGGYAGSGSNRYTNSVIDEVAIYFGLLSSTKISQHAALI